MQCLQVENKTWILLRKESIACVPTRPNLKNFIGKLLPQDGVLN